MTGPRHGAGFFEADRPARPSPPPPAPQPPRPALRPARLGAIFVILVAAVGGGVADRVLHRPVLAPAPPTAVTEVAAAGVESSSWYCAGGTPAAGSLAEETLGLVNTTSRPVAGTLFAVSDRGRRGAVGLVVPAHGQLLEVPGPLVGGNFVAATVELDGGGVLVNESVASTTGWSTTSCSRSTSSNWYFASGATVNGGTLALSLYNPATTEAVVDLTFVTPAGLSEPQPFEGIVVPAGSLAVEEVDRYVQDQSSVSAIVTARTGSVVADELQAVSTHGIHGLSLRLGVPTLFPAWSVPRSIDLTGGTTAITVFNPSLRPDRVSVEIRPFRSPPAEFSQAVAPRSAWVLETTQQTRIPDGIPFLATVRVRGGPGVVVDRITIAPSSFQGPQFGAVTALALGPAQPATPVAVLPSPGTPGHPTVPGAGLGALSLFNPGTQPAHVRVWALATTAGLVRLASATLPAGASLTLASTASTGVRRAAGLSRLGRVPVLVSADQPVSVLEDLVPTATGGVVSLAGAPAGAP